MGLFGAVLVAIGVIGGLVFFAFVVGTRSKQRDVWEHFRERASERWPAAKFEGRRFVVSEDGVDVSVAIADLQRDDDGLEGARVRARFGVTAHPIEGTLPELAEGTVGALARAGLAPSGRPLPEIPRSQRLSIRTGPTEIAITGLGEIETIASAIVLAATLATAPQRALEAAARERGKNVDGAAFDLGEGIEVRAAGGLRVRRATPRPDATLEALVEARAGEPTHARLVELVGKLGARAEVTAEHVDVVLHFDASRAEIDEAAELLRLLDAPSAGERA